MASKIIRWLSEDEFDPNKTPYLKDILGRSIWVSPDIDGYKGRATPYTLMEFYSWDDGFQEENNMYWVEFTFNVKEYGAEDWYPESIRLTCTFDITSLVEATIDHNAMLFYEMLGAKLLTLPALVEETPEFKILYGKKD